MIRTKFSTFDYLTNAESDKLWGLYVTSSGMADVPAHIPYPPAKHPNTYMFDWKNGRVLPEFAIVYITRGEGIFESKATGKKQIKEGTIFLLFPGVWHTYLPNPRTGWKEYWVTFDGFQPQNFMQHKILSPDKPVLEIGFNETLIQLYHHILELLEEETIGYREIIASLTYQIIAQVHATERGRQFGSKEIETVVKKAKIYLVENIDKAVDFEQLASELNVGYSWFRRMFRHYTGLAPCQYLLQLKLNKAKELLSETSLPIKQISWMIGFESQYYFSKYFKKKLGVSPTQWRQFSRGELNFIPPSVANHISNE